MTPTESRVWCCVNKGSFKGCYELYPAGTKHICTISQVGGRSNASAHSETGSPEGDGMTVELSNFPAYDEAMADNRETAVENLKDMSKRAKIVGGNDVTGLRMLRLDIISAADAYAKATEEAKGYLVEEDR
jgi:hypothetical protein